MMSGVCLVGRSSCDLFLVEYTLLWKNLFNKLAFGHKPPCNGQDCGRQERNDKSSHLICVNSRSDKFDVNIRG